MVSEVKRGPESGLSPHQGRVLPLRPFAVCASLMVQVLVNRALSSYVAAGMAIATPPTWGSRHIPSQGPELFRHVILSAPRSPEL